jgi:hypothetical protein
VAVALYQSTPSLAGSLRRNPTPTDPWTVLRDDASYEERRLLREQTNWDRSIDAESATWSGLLIDLAESNATVALHLTTGHTVSGQITSVGVDVVCVVAGNTVTAIATSAVTQIETGSKPVAANGEREGSEETLHSIIERAAEEHREIALTLRGSTSDVFGKVLSCGTNVCTITSSENPRHYVHVATGSVVALRMDAR